MASLTLAPATNLWPRLLCNRQSDSQSQKPDVSSGAAAISPMLPKRVAAFHKRVA